MSNTLRQAIYATDASMYQIVPAAVHAPRDRQEVINLVKECRDKNRPLLPRWVGTNFSLTGQSIHETVLLDLSQHNNKVFEVNVEAQWVGVESSVVCADLNAQIKSTGLHFAPDPATQNRASFGSMTLKNPIYVTEALTMFL